jgi:hypothetical protein
MKILVLAQDLRVSGTSEGVVSRSFLAKLRKAYPESTIHVEYIKSQISDDNLELIPVDKIRTHQIDIRIPKYIHWINKLYWRIFNQLLTENWVLKQYKKVINTIQYKDYDHIFIRSAGINHDIILACANMEILNHSIVNFHDPFPHPWYIGSNKKPNKLEANRLLKMISIVANAKRCISTAKCMAHDLEYLYASKQEILTLPHHYVPTVFDLSDQSQVEKKNKKISISYHGALMLGRDIESLLSAYIELINEDNMYKQQTEFVLRVKTSSVGRLRKKYENSNVIFRNTTNFSNSSYEQIYESDIVIILENGPLYSNTLMGKVPFLAYYNKPILCVSPARSELRSIISSMDYIATIHNKNEIKTKLKKLILKCMNNDKLEPIFGDYFSDQKFKQQLDFILEFNNKK